jgi:hypothetical protein
MGKQEEELGAILGVGRLLKKAVREGSSEETSK